MPDFLKSRFTIEPGKGMDSYSLGHFIWLGLLFFLIFFLGKKYRAADEDKRKKIRIAIASLIMLDEIVKDIIMPITGQWDWNFLPLHLCSISVFVVFIHALTGNRMLEEYTYAITLPTASMAMAFPDWTGALPCMNLMCIHSFSIHLLLVLYPCLLLYGGFIPSAKQLFRLIPIVAFLAFVMYFVNGALGTNFFFVNGGGDGNPLTFLEKYIGGWYRLAFPVIAAICWIPMYLPFRNKAKTR
ncbi:MAG: YwaF family protein [Spirochaetes bacterium]|uniref:YwaF family protein n=1 Tax=Candidatus Ornithospirochaeta stercoravium TaxID=2840897 RepID=A0A9D9ID12_9SPIO|nr:YwaF family protein [Candidatus Ornithospirochaeta stercoravium]